MKRALQAVALAPAHPPCFGSQAQWTEFVAAAAEDYPAMSPEQDPLTRVGKAAAFNLNFNFCRECTAAHADRKRAAGRCDPAWLIRLLPAATAAASAPAPVVGAGAFSSETT